MNTFESPGFELDLEAPQTIGNLAEDLDEAERMRLASDVIEMVNIDKSSMSDWLGEAQAHLDRVNSEKNDAQPQNAEQQGSNEENPPSTELTMSAVIQFTASITSSILSEPDLAKASEATDSGEALAAWVSKQLRTVDPDWVNDTDPLTLHMAITGLGWRKRWFDDHDQKFRSTWLPVKDVIVNSHAKSLARVPRITHRIEKYPYEIRRSIQMGHWVDYEPRFDDIDPQALQEFYETDLWLDMDGDGEDEPWTVTIALDSGAQPQIVKCVPRWTRKTVTATKDLLLFTPPRRYYAYKMIPDPEGSFFPKGFGWLLKRIESSTNRLLASIDDTAKSQSENGGVAATGAVGLPEKIELKGNRLNIIPTDGRPVGEVLSLFPDKQVTPGMVSTLEKMITLGDRLAGTLNALENAPASMTATLAKGIIDTGHQIQGAAHRRIIGEITEELRAFVAMADGMDQLPDGMVMGPIEVTADPNMATEMHRAAAAEVYHGMMQMPMIFDVQECALRYGQAMRLPNPEKLVKVMGPPQPSQQERVEAAIKLGKNAIDKIKAKGQVILQIAQAVKALTDAGVSAANAELVQLEMQKLNGAVMELNEDADTSSAAISGVQGMEGTPGDGSMGGSAAPGASPPGATLPVGQFGGPAGTGPGSGVVPGLGPS